MKTNAIPLIVLASSLLFSIHANAWVAAGHGGGYYHSNAYYHGGYYHDRGYYYGSGWGAPGVMIGVPQGAYYGYGGCSLVQHCYPNETCVNKRICD